MPWSVRCAQAPAWVLFAALNVADLVKLERLSSRQEAFDLVVIEAITCLPVALVWLSLRIRRRWVWWTLIAVFVSLTIAANVAALSRATVWSTLRFGSPMDLMRIAFVASGWIAVGLLMTPSARQWFRRPNQGALDGGAPAS